MEMKRNRAGGHEELTDEVAAFSQGVFGVLYTVSKETSPGWGLAVFRMFFDALQLWLLVVSPAYGFNGWINPDNKAWQVVSVINLSQFLEARGYVFYLVSMYTMTVGLALAILLCVWVSSSFRNNRFDQVWPIVVLRVYSLLFFQILGIASVTLFLLSFDCQMTFSPSPRRFWHQEFPDVYCWSVPHIVHAVIAGISLAVFSIMGGMFTMAEMELNPLSTNWMAVADPKVEVLAYFIKFFMAAASTVIMQLKWLSCIQSAGVLWLLYLYMCWSPHMHKHINHIRVGTCTAVFYCSIMFILIAWQPGVDYDDDKAVDDWNSMVTIAMWSGVVPVGLLGHALSYIKLEYLYRNVLPLFSDDTVGPQARAARRFTDARQVEILARCCRKWDAHREELDADSMRLAEQVMKAGMAALPNNASMIILYSSFLIEVQTSYQSGYSILQAAKKSDPSFLERFAIFSREQQHTQKSSGEAGGQATDLVSYVQYQRNYRLVMKTHKEALLAIRAFWQCLLQSHVKFDAMSAAIERMDLAVKQADRVYRMVLQRHSSNLKIVRLYAKFLENVKYDPWNAAKWFMEAEQMQREQEASKQTNVFEDIDIEDPQLRASLLAMGPMADARSIVIINAHGIVQVANHAASALTGFASIDLIGRNVNVIIPTPMAEQHTSYIRQYLNTGRGLMINKCSYFVALHRERYVIPISLSISKVSGIGEDTMFMGVMEALPPDEDAACMWVLFSGQVVCADVAWNDWFAWKTEEVVGTTLSRYCLEPKRLDGVLRAARSSYLELNSRHLALPRNGAGAWRKSHAPEHALNSAGAEHGVNAAAAQEVWEERGILFIHKYAEPVCVDLKITNGAVGAHYFNVLTMRRAQCTTSWVGAIPQPRPALMMVSDKKGRLLHITQPLASALGSTTKALMGSTGMLSIETLLVQPFAQLHRSLAIQVPPYAPPPFSCRAGISVLFSSVGPQGLDATPLSMLISRKQQSLQDVIHVAQMVERSMPEALAERCMSLSLDPRGYVVGVGSECTAGTAFGFSPRQLLGLHVSTFIDILCPSGGAAATALPQRPVGTPPASRGRAGGRALEGGDLPHPQAGVPLCHVSAEEEGTVGRLLLELAAKTADAPGVSWRCGMTNPYVRKLGSGLMENTSNIAAALLGRSQAMPGILQVELAVEPEPGSEADEAGGAAGGPTHFPPVPAETPLYTHNSSSSRPATPNIALMSMATAIAPGVAVAADVAQPQSTARTPAALRPPSRGTAAYTPGASSVLPAAFTGEEDEINRRLRYKVKVWNAKLACSVLELDSSGYVAVPSQPKVDALYPPSLVLGVPTDELLGGGCHFSALLPPGSAVRTVADLMEACVPGAQLVMPVGREFSGQPMAGMPSGPSTRRMSSLGLRAPVGADDRCSPVHLFHASHFGDAQPIRITVQAVPKLARTGRAYLIVHPHAPECGRSEFIGWVLSGGLRPAGQLTAEDKHLAFMQSRQLKSLRRGAQGRRSSCENLQGLIRHPSGGSQVPSQVLQRAGSSRVRISTAHLHHGPVRGASSTMLTLPVLPYASSLLPSSNTSKEHPVPQPPPQAMQFAPQPPGRPTMSRTSSSLARTTSFRLGPETTAAVPTTSPLEQPEDCSGPPDGQVTVLNQAEGPAQDMDTAQEAADAEVAAITGGQEPQGLAILAPVRVPHPAHRPLGALEPIREQVSQGAQGAGAQEEEQNGEEIDTGGDATAATLQASAEVLAGPGVQQEVGVDARAPVEAERQGSGDGGVKSTVTLARTRSWVLSVGGGGASDGEDEEPATFAHVHVPGYTTGGCVAGGYTTTERVGCATVTPGLIEPEVAGVMQRSLSMRGLPAVDVNRPPSVTSDRGEADAPEAPEAAAHSEEDEDGASYMDEAPGVVDHSVTDYRRGRRYKKLARMLGSQIVQQYAKRFKLHSLLVVAAIMCIHVAIFAVMYYHLEKEKVGVLNLNRAGLAIQAAAEAGISMRKLDMMLNPETLPAAPDINLTHPVRNFDSALELKLWLNQQLATFKHLHQLVYRRKGGSQLPQENGLRDMWQTNSLEEVLVFDVNATTLEPVTSVTKNSLYNIGDKLFAAADFVARNGEAVQNSSNLTDLAAMPEFQYYLINMPNVLAESYYMTMDGLVKWVISGAEYVNRIHLVVLIVEGCVLSCGAVAYMWLLSLQVGRQRHAMYSVFMAIPQALARTLSTKELDLDDEDDGDDGTLLAEARHVQQVEQDSGVGVGAAVAVAGRAAGGAPAAAAGAASTKEPQPPGPQPFTTSLTMSAAPARLNSTFSNVYALRDVGCWGRLRQRLEGWVTFGKVPVAGAKRVLRQSLRQSVMLTWAFLMWGVMIVTCYAVAMQQLEQVRSPIATFNMVNFVAMRTALYLFDLQEVMVAVSETHATSRRQMLNTKLDALIKDYTAMLYGGHALPNETSDHYRFAVTGLAFSKGEGGYILFDTRECLVLPALRSDHCKEDPSNAYYGDTHNGLATLMNQYISRAQAMHDLSGREPGWWSDKFAWFLYTRFDVQGGLQQLESYYHDEVESFFKEVEAIHIAALVLTVIMMLGFLLVILRPFLNKTRNETRRIAELLSQLPPDIDVEGLVVRALLAARNTDAGKVAPEDAGPAAKSDAAGATKTYTARDWHSVIAAAKAEKNLWNGTAEKVNGPQL